MPLKKFRYQWLLIGISGGFCFLIYVSLKKGTFWFYVSVDGNRHQATDYHHKVNTDTERHTFHSLEPVIINPVLGGYDLLDVNFFTGSQQESLSNFTAVEGSGVYVIHDICIEERVGEPSTEKVLVVYNSPKRMQGTHTIKPSISANSKIKSWTLTFNTSPIPETHRVITSHPAYFISPSCPGNLYHFWADSTKQLYGTLKATNRLNATGEANQVFYPASYREWAQADWDGRSCYDPSRFQDILFALGIRHWHGWYGYAPVNVCYTDSVFGFFDSNIEDDEAEQFIIRAMGYRKEKCSAKPTVTILQRSTRRILNAEELLNASQALGFHNTAIHNFEGMSVTQQFNIASCSDILIGVQGAGMAWLYFMPNTSGIIEIAWPEKQWRSKYLNRAHLRGMKAAAILNPPVFPNWEVYAKREGSGIPFLEDEKQSLLQRETVWKWADTKVDVQEFKSVLSRLKSLLEHKPV